MKYKSLNLQDNPRTTHLASNSFRSRVTNKSIPISFDTCNLFSIEQSHSFEIFQTSKRDEITDGFLFSMGDRRSLEFNAKALSIVKRVIYVP